MKINYKLGAFVISLIGVSAVVLFGVLSLNLGENWSSHIKALYLMNYALLVLIIISFLISSDKKSNKKKGEKRKK